MSTAEQNSYDLIVIGAGPAGYPAALEAAALGRKVAVIDRRAPGGTCLHCGCIPMKTLLHYSRLYRESAAAVQPGIFSAAPQLDAEKLCAQKESVIASLTGGIQGQFERAGITFIRGDALVTAPDQVTVRAVNAQAETLLRAPGILIAAGSQPAHIPVPGLELSGIDDSTSLLARTSLYKSLIIIGGGVIGMEFASFYSDLGIPVTVLEAAPSILPAMESELSRSLKMVLAKRGVAMHAGVKVCCVQKSPDGGFICTYKDGETEKTAAAQGLLAATGRTACGNEVCSPQMAQMLHIEKGRIPADECGRTAVSGIYAAGDVTAKIQLAHAATAAGLNAVATLYGNVPVKDLSLIPSCVYSDPEIACIGMSEADAAAAGIEAVSAKYLMTANGKSVLSGQERGFIKITVQKKTGIVLGARLMCDRATDMTGIIALAVSRKMTVRELAALVMPHPTFSEGIAEAAAECIKRL